MASGNVLLADGLCHSDENSCSGLYVTSIATPIAWAIMRMWRLPPFFW